MYRTNIEEIKKKMNSSNEVHPNYLETHRYKKNCTHTQKIGSLFGNVRKKFKLKKT